MKILIIEDGPKTGSYLKQGLTEAGFVVDLVRDGLDGMHMALSEPYDLVSPTSTFGPVDHPQLDELIMSASVFIFDSG